MRPRGERPDRAWRRVTRLAAVGDLAGAAAALRELADRARLAGDRGHASAALRLAATLSRALGDPAEATRLAEAATALAGGEPRWALPARAELARSRLAAGDPAGAAAALSHAATLAAGGRDADGLRYAEAYAWGLAGRPDLAGAALDATAGDEVTMAVEVLADRAPAAQADPATAAAQEAATRATWASDAPSLLADHELAAAADALNAGDLPAALQRLQVARWHALDADARLSFVAAAVAESAVAERLGQDHLAYAALVTGHTTLGELVGRPVGGATFTPHLRRLRKRWGSARFAAARAAYVASQVAA